MKTFLIIVALLILAVWGISKIELPQTDIEAHGQWEQSEVVR